MSNKENMLTVEEAATYLKVNPETVRRWLRDGKLAGANIGGFGWRIRKTDIDAFFSKKEVSNE